MIRVVDGEYDAMTDERMDEILRERGRRLSMESSESDSGEQLEALEFRLGDELYAVASALVGEVMRPGAPTPVPCTPPHIAGIVDLRGRVVAVLDLKSLLGLGDAGSSPDRRVVVLRSGNAEAGILADSLEGIRCLSPRDIHPPLPSMAGERGVYVMGVEAGGTVILDGERILSDESLVVDDRV